jgi:nanoRNase/pAp phosphatase (c-di-AMP/oligoRNAs hydrolase)
MDWKRRRFIEMSEDYQNLVTQERLQALRAAAGAGPLLVLTHDNPDPDAMASGSALAALCSKLWNVQTRLAYSGLVARAENKTMLAVLTPEWEPIENINDLYLFPACALVDTQPGSGNNSLPSDLVPRIVIDHHHPIRDGLDNIQFLDIQTEMGATSSIVYQYLEAAGIEPGPTLSTAIFYGIQTDTQSLSRSGSSIDQEIYFKLLSRIDREKLIQVIQAGLPREYFKAFNEGLKATRVYGKAVISYLGQLHRPDFVAEMADALIRLEDARAVLCLGYHDDLLYLSLRTPTVENDAGHLIQAIVTPNGKAGGHGTIAGGQIRINDKSVEKTVREVQNRFLQLMKESGRGEKLLE